MRGREFLMKDAYTFDADFDAAKRAYDNMFLAYLRTFNRMGLTAIPMVAESGPIGGNMSYEFQILAQTGESAVHYDAAFEELDLTDPHLDIGRLKSLYARRTTCTIRPRARCRPSGYAQAAASRSGTSSTSAPSTPSRWAPR